AGTRVAQPRPWRSRIGAQSPRLPLLTEQCRPAAALRTPNPSLHVRIAWDTRWAGGAARTGEPKQPRHRAGTCGLLKALNPHRLPGRRVSAAEIPLKKIATQPGSGPIPIPA